MSEVLDRDAKSSRQTKISQFKKPLSVNQKILRLEISMKHFVTMALFDAIQQLIKVFLRKTSNDTIGKTSYNKLS